MNVLFLTLAKINNIEERGIYTDLLREFVKKGHKVFIVSPIERKYKKITSINKQDEVTILNVKTLNLQKTNFLEKGIGTIALEYQYLKAIKKHLSKVKFDLLLYSTPPITFTKVIQYIKRKHNSYSYLLLKDIFPQNAVDLNLIKKNSIIHRYFLKKEKKLYQISDTIGCMSIANKDYILKNNPTLSHDKVEVNPNSIFPLEIEDISLEQKNIIRKKHKLPLDKKIFIYGGNLGLPQGIDFLIKVLENNNNKDAYFLIVGSGTEYYKLEKWFNKTKPKNASLIPFLEKKDYDNLVTSCDIGLIFLDKRFTIPNFPSRLLSYLEMKLPVIAATDKNSDIGKVIENNNCGFYVEAGNIKSMDKAIDKAINHSDIKILRKNAIKLLKEQYHVKNSYLLIEEKIKNV